MLYQIIKGYLLEIRSPAMLIAILTAILGSAAATMGGLFPMNVTTVILHACNVFTILYMSHLVDTLNDKFIRSEYEHGYATRLGDAGKQPLTKKHFEVGIAVSFTIALVLTVYLTQQTGLLYAGIAVFGIILALAYGSGLDKYLLLGDLAWELGVVFSLWGGFYVQAGSLEMPIMMMALMILPALTGFKIVDALPDIEPDKYAEKITIPVKLGFKAANTLAYILIAITIVVLGQAIKAGMLPPPLIYTIILFGGLTGIAASLNARRSVYVLMIAFIGLMAHSIYLLYPPLF